MGYATTVRPRFHLSGNRSSAIVAGVSSSPPRRVALFVTCLVDLFRPSVGFAAVKLLEDAGCIVEVPPLQVCCGQPAYNSGDRASTKAIARQVIDAFEGYRLTSSRRRAPAPACWRITIPACSTTIRR